MLNYNLLKLKLVRKYPQLSRFVRANWGYIEEKLKPEDYHFGAVTNKKILRPDGDWTSLTPTPERQSGRSIETMACTCFSAINVIETLIMVKFNLDVNYSDRFLAKLSGVTRNGNVQSKVMEAIRKVGLVKEEDYPSNLDTFTWDEYYKPLTADLYDKAHEFGDTYDFNYEAVTPTIPALIDSLRYAPLYVAGYAWSFDGTYFQSYGSPNHCFMLANIDQVIKWKQAFDTYEPFLKKLSPNYQIYYPKLFTLNKKGESFNLQEIAKLIARGFKYIIRPLGNGEIYELLPTGLKYISPQDWNTIAVQMSSDQKKLIGISEDLYSKLLA